MQHSSDVAYFTLSDENADPDNWDWGDESRATWKPAGPAWQEFHDRWYGATDSPSQSKSLSLPFEFLTRHHRFMSSSLFVRESYVTMFDTVWAKAIASEGSEGSGVIITGQPGTGKTLFQCYLLVRLLQRKQIVLFSLDGTTMYLFYHSYVYKATMDELAVLDTPLPKPISSSNVFVWSLFDIHELKEPVWFLVSNACFPVQTASPNPMRYRTWRKEQIPLLTGLPLWTRDELAQGLRYHRRYHSLLGALSKVYKSSSPSSSDPLAFYPGARALLEEQYSEEDTVQPSPEDALDCLLDAAIDRFGSSARDVFGAVFDYQGVTRLHEEPFGIKYADLQDAVSALSRNRNASYSSSHMILTLRPVNEGPLVSVRWNVDFKSDWVAKSVIRQLGEAEDNVIHQQIHFFRNIPGARGLAGRFLEPLAHRYIADAKDATDGPWPLINMNFSGTDPPQFTLVRDTPVPDNVQFVKVKRKIVKLQSIAQITTCLKNNSYYVPEDPSFPLFDAFTIELDREKKSAILWVIQVTTSRIHGGSTNGYRKIREIIAILRDELRGDPPLKKSKTSIGQAAPLVQVRYLLTVPKDEPGFLQWEFPKGWSQNWKKNDHRGNVYCLEVPLA